MPLNLGRRRFLGAMRPLFAGLRSVPPLGDVLIVAAVYFAAAKLGLRLAFYHPSATPVWPPTGIALPSILLLGSRGGDGMPPERSSLRLCSSSTARISVSAGVAKQCLNVVSFSWRSFP